MVSEWEWTRSKLEEEESLDGKLSEVKVRLCGKL